MSFLFAGLLPAGGAAIAQHFPKLASGLVVAAPIAKGVGTFGAVNMLGIYANETYRRGTGDNIIADKFFGGDEDRYNIYCNVATAFTILGGAVHSLGMGAKAYFFSLNPNDIRFSQSSVNGAEEIVNSMKSNGWKGDPIDVVKMPDGQLTTIDNTRVVAARQAGIDVQAKIHGYNDPLPNNFINRFTTPKAVPTTWGDAIILRIGKQNAVFRNSFPLGSYDLPKIK